MLENKEKTTNLNFDSIYFFIYIAYARFYRGESYEPDDYWMRLLDFYPHFDRDELSILSFLINIRRQEGENNFH
jgi:hypothetical protein